MRKVAADRLTLAHTFVDRHIARTAAYNSRRDRSIFTIVCQTAAELTLRPGSFLLLLLLRFFVFLFSFFPRPFSLDDEPRKLGVSCRPLRYNPVIVPQVCACFHYKSLFPGDSIRFKILTPPSLSLVHFHGKRNLVSTENFPSTKKKKKDRRQGLISKTRETRVLRFVVGTSFHELVDSPEILTTCNTRSSKRFAKISDCPLSGPGYIAVRLARCFRQICRR